MDNDEGAEIPMASDQMSGAYQRSILVYLDILGFGNKIKEAGSDPSKIQSIYEALTMTKALVTLLGEPCGEDSPADRPELKTRMFSDTIVISCQTVSDESLHYVVQDVAISQFLILRKGYFLRGAITLGDHYQEGDLVFGPSLIKAYELEQQLATWPRVVIDPSAFGGFSQKFFSAALSAYLSRDQYGILYVDYLKCEWINAVSQKNRKGKPSRHDSPEGLFLEHKGEIVEAMNSEKAKEDLRIMTKYHALASYHNETIDNICDGYLSIIEYQIDAGEEKNRLQSYKIDLSDAFRELYVDK